VRAPSTSSAIAERVPDDDHALSVRAVRCDQPRRCADACDDEGRQRSCVLLNASRNQIMRRMKPRTITPRTSSAIDPGASWRGGKVRERDAGAVLGVASRSAAERGDAAADFKTTAAEDAFRGLECQVRGVFEEESYDSPLSFFIEDAVFYEASCDGLGPSECGDWCDIVEVEPRCKFLG
jgi:hypothetical protein